MTKPESFSKAFITSEQAQDAVKTLLTYVGEDPNREGLLQTPKRVIRAFEEYCSGYKENPEDILNTYFEEVCGYEQPVILRDIPFYSHCEHHLAPIHGIATVSYLPEKKVVGISKLARVVESFARRLQIQEKMTAQIAECIQNSLSPKGVAVYIKAIHHCMLGRGVNINGASLVTTHYTGIYRQDELMRKDFLRLISLS